MFILKELRTEHGLKRSELARETGINANTLANYEKGTRQASYETLILLADYFNVTVDELLGREEKPDLPRAFGGNPARPIRARWMRRRWGIDGGKTPSARRILALMSAQIRLVTNGG